MKIFDVETYNRSSEDLEKTIKGYVNDSSSKFIAKANSEFFLRAYKNPEFKKVLQDADLVIPDGIGVLWAARFLTLKTSSAPILRELQILWQAKYSLLSLIFNPKFCRYPIPERIPGVEALYLMLRAASDTNSSVFFLGAEEEVNKKAVEKIKKKFPKLIVAGAKGGYWKDDSAVIDEINKSGAKLLIVALGSPKQEYWIRDNVDKLKTVKVAVGEGGSLDFVAGSFRRAPKGMQNMGLEWFWRLLMNKSKSSTGSRLKRIWEAVPVFILAVISDKINRSNEAVHE